MEARGAIAEDRDGGGVGARSRDKQSYVIMSPEELGRQLERLTSSGSVSFPDVYHSPHLSYYERFKAYQDYILGDCRPSEVRSFMGEYLEETVEPSGWSAVWRSGAFDVLVEVKDVYFDDLKALVSLAEPLLFEYSVPVATAVAAGGSSCYSTGGATPAGAEALGSPAAPAGPVAPAGRDTAEQALERLGRRVDLRELWVVYDDSGTLSRTALAIEHVRFFLGHIWRALDEEDDDDYDYFVRCVDPRLKLYYDVLEGRIPAGIMSEYARLRSLFDSTYAEFCRLRSSISEEADAEEIEQDRAKVARGVELYENLETTKRKLQIMENPVLRYVLGYHTGTEGAAKVAHGPRADGSVATHVVARSVSLAVLSALTLSLTHSLARSPTRPLGEELSGDEEQSVHLHSSLQGAMDASYEGDHILLCPGVYSEEGICSIAESVTIEGFGVADDVVIEMRGHGDVFVECSARCVTIANVKFIQHGASEGILRVLRGKAELKECVLQCETSGVTVRPKAHLTLKNCNLYGAKGAGVEVCPGSSCTLMGNEIHHCREGVLIMDFMESVYDMPKLSMMNNLISNNDGYGVSLLKPEGLKPRRPVLLKGTSADLRQSPVPLAPVCGDDGDDGDDGGDDGDDGDNGGRATPPVMEPEEAITVELMNSSQKKMEWRDSAVATATAEQPMETQYRRRQMSGGEEVAAASAQTAGDLPVGIFLSIVGNAFCRNGKGSFGVLYY